MPPKEQRALLTLLALAVVGQLVRQVVTRPGEAPGQVQLLSTLGSASPVAQRDSAMRLGRPLQPGERIDLDQASVAEITRLPKVGPRLAKVILANREEQGPFGSLAGLDRVPGIGPGLLRSIGPHVIFSGAAGQTGRGADIYTVETPCAVRDAAPLPPCPSAPLNINTASASDLDALPGIGPAKAAAILQYRAEHGRFARVEELTRVPGFGAALVSRLEPRLTVH